MFVAMTASDITKWIAFGGCQLTHLHGTNNNGAVVYIQLFQAPTALAGDVPSFKSLLCPAGQNFFFDWPPTSTILSELFIALSSTETSYTAVGAGAGLDMTVTFNSDFPVGTDTTLTGDLTTGVASKQVWAQASGPKRLMRLDIKNNAGANTYPYISAVDSPAAKNSAMRNLAVIANGATKTYTFGKAGYSPFESVQTSVTTNRQGCTVVLSASGDIGTTTLVAAASFNIRAVYDT